MTVKPTVKTPSEQRLRPEVVLVLLGLQTRLLPDELLHYSPFSLQATPFNSETCLQSRNSSLSVLISAVPEGCLLHTRVCDSS